jgi:hypothetical protein
MKFPSSISNAVKSFSKVELGLIGLFIIYLVFPIDTPHFLARYVDSSLGMLAMFVITVFLFLYSNPFLAVLFIFVAYELLRRSAQVAHTQTVIQHTPAQTKKDAEMRAMNPPKKATLEEEVVDKMAPIGHSDPVTYMTTSFTPVAESTNGASQY